MPRPLGLVARLTAALTLLAALGTGPQIALAQPPAAPAANFVVNSLADLPDADLSNPACLASNSKCTLRAALDQAGNSVALDTITFSVTGTITLLDYLTPVTHTLTLTGPGPNLLTINGNGYGPVLAVIADDPAAPVNISGLTLTGGESNQGGGAFFNGQAPVIVTNVIITGNVANQGAGLATNSPTTIIDSVITHNRAGSQGGGLYSNLMTELINTRVEENEVQPDGTTVSAQGSAGYGGGGLFATGTLTLTSSFVLSNTAAASNPVAASLSALEPAASSGPYGAGLYLYDGAAVITDSLIAGNAGVACLSCTVPPLQGANPAGVHTTFYGDGGGVYAYNSGWDSRHTRILSNTAQVGGGLMVVNAQATLQTTLVADNRAENGGGLVVSNANGYLSDVVVRDNWAVSGDGGGLYIYGGYGSLSQVLIAHNHAGIDGGGVLAVNADFYMGYSQVEGNSAGTPLPIAQGQSLEPQIISDAGGGLYIGGGEANIFNSAIVSNTATLGGGINSGGTLSVVNTTISGNHANRDGGGVRQMPLPVTLASGQAPPPTTADLMLVTVVNNTADADDNGSGDGGGLFATPGLSITLHNTLLALNTDLGGEAGTCAGVADSTGYNLVDVTAGCPITATTGDQFNVAPGILALADNGGGTLSHALIFASLARDTGDPDPSFCYPQDQRNVVRPFGPRCDIGAFELSGLFLPLLTR